MEMKYELNPALDVVYLKNLFREDYAVIKVIFETFLSEIVPKWVSIKSMIVEKDLIRLKQELHGLKPAVTIVGLARLKPQLEEMEGTLFKHPVDFEAMLIAYNAITVELENMVPIFEEEIVKLNKLV